MAGIPLNHVIGDRELCAWQPMPGIVWVQTRLPKHARRLGQRRDGRLVAAGVAGGYLKTFEFRHSMSWARRLMTRYTASLKTTNARLNRTAGPQAHPVSKADPSTHGHS